MAMRGGAMRRMPGNPLGGMLRDLDRRARTTTRSAGRRAPAGDPPAGEAGPQGERGPAGPPGRSTAAAIATTGDDGRARWTFPAPYDVPPVLAALPAGQTPLVPAVEEVTAAHAVVRLWTLTGSSAGAGVHVHLMASPGPRDEGSHAKLGSRCQSPVF